MKTNIQELREEYTIDDHKAQAIIDQTCEALWKDFKEIKFTWSEESIELYNKIEKLLEGGKCNEVVEETGTLCGRAIDEEEAPYPAYCKKHRKKEVKDGRKSN